MARIPTFEEATPQEYIPATSSRAPYDPMYDPKYMRELALAQSGLGRYYTAPRNTEEPQNPNQSPVIANLGNTKQERIMRMVDEYNNNPDAFDDTDIAQLQIMAAANGVPFEAEFSYTRAAKNLAYGFTDMALFGALPDSWKPTTLTTGEEIAGQVGGLLGFANPYMAGKTILAKGAGWAAKAGSAAKGSKVGEAVVKGVSKGGKAEGVGKVASKAKDSVKPIKEKYDDFIKVASDSIDEMGLTNVVKNMGKTGAEVGMASALSDALGQSEFGSSLGRAVSGAVTGGVFGAIAPAVGAAEAGAIDMFGISNKLLEGVTRLGVRGAGLAVWDAMTPDAKERWSPTDVRNWMLALQLITGRGVGSPNLAKQGGVSPMPGFDWKLPKMPTWGKDKSGKSVTPESPKGQMDLF